ncbi:hypothetical protein BDV95DRAFT_81852 [Massariosphaeria phaeospora]|uniref:Uncharacterized protein n=1 Tax=Massariosphaeria phaeospora TaxID=100035 RepID=A0A7C8I458_9PLEO|nr:hypothetical protein BDV95DRAFT_81852 [Massariosphaeria phaeospora]
MRVLAILFAGLGGGFLGSLVQGFGRQAAQREDTIEPQGLDMTILTDVPTETEFSAEPTIGLDTSRSTHAARVPEDVSGDFLTHEPSPERPLDEDQYPLGFGKLLNLSMFLVRVIKSLLSITVSAVYSHIKSTMIAAFILLLAIIAASLYTIKQRIAYLHEKSKTHLSSIAVIERRLDVQAQEKQVIVGLIRTLAEVPSSYTCQMVKDITDKLERDDFTGHMRAIMSVAFQRLHDLDGLDDPDSLDNQATQNTSLPADSGNFFT